MKVNKFAIQLKYLREEKGITQTKLAKDLCLSQTTIAKYESGTHEPDYELLIKIAKYFDTTTDFLLGLED